jgi:hypothetical protein
VQGREAALTPAVDVRAGIEQQPRERNGANEGRRAERRDADGLVRRECGRIGTPLEQQPRRLLLASEDRQVQRREAVLGERGRLRLILVEDPPEGIEPTEGGGLEDRQLVVRREQLSRLRCISAVQSLQSIAHASSLLTDYVGRLPT